MKRLLAMILAAALFCLALAGCGDSDSGGVVSGGDEAKPKVTLEETGELTLYVHQYTKGSMDYAISLYKEAYPNVNLNIVDYSTMDIWEFRTKLSGEIQSGKGPDVIFVDFLVGNLYKTALSGAFYDLNDVMASDQEFNLDDYNTAAMDTGVVDGKRYLVPVALYSPFIMTTQTIVDELGIDIKKCDNVIGLGEEINRILKENPSQRIFKQTQQAYELFVSLGLDIVDYAKGEIIVDEDSLKQFADIFKVLNEQDKSTSDMSYSSTVDAYNNLSEKLEVFEFMPSRDVNDIFINMSGLNWKGDNPILIPLKTADGKLQSTVNMGAAVSSNSPNKLNGYNFIKILISEEMQKFSQYPLGIPVRKSGVDSQIIENQTGLAENENALLEQCGFVMKLPEQKVIDEFAAQLKGVEHSAWDTNAHSYAYSSLVGYMNGEKDFETAMEEFKSQLEIYITE